jgi:hypothetical protein
MAGLTQVEIQFNPGMSMRDILNQPQLKGYRIGELKAIMLSPTRINDILPFLHKPSARPNVDFEMPSGSLFRGMVFGHIFVFSNRGLSKGQALVLLEQSGAPAAETPASPPPEEAPYPVYDAAAAAAQAPEPAASESVSMVGLPSSGSSQAAAPPPAEGRTAPPEPVENVKIDPYPTPSPEKLKRWTEIIPSGTRVLKPKYPAASEPVEPEPEPEPDPQPEPEPEPELKSRPGPSPSDVDAPTPTPDEFAIEQGQEHGVKYAKEADLLLRKIIDIIEHDHVLSFELKSDQATELRMLQLELSKFKPNIPRITGMILGISDVEEAGHLIARLKECLQGLGLLL